MAAQMFWRGFIFKRTSLKAALFALAGLLAHSVNSEILPPGFRPLPATAHALVGGRVFVKPGEVITNATIIIRDGFIQAVAPDAPVPPDARIWDVKGLTIYAGFIDPYVLLENKNDMKQKGPERSLSAGGINFYGLPPQTGVSGGINGPGYEVAMIKPERRVALTYLPDSKEIEKLRELGFTTANIVPDKGLLRGTSAFVALSDGDANHGIIKPDMFQHIVLDDSAVVEDSYPDSLMGFIAAIRQSFFDAQHYALEQADYAEHPDKRKRPAYNLGDEALAAAVAKKMTVIFEPRDALMVDRSARVARELGINYSIVASGEEWRRPDLAKAAGVPFIVPLNFPVLPKMPQEDDWQQVSLEQLRAWDWAPENPATLQQQGLPIALSTYGLDDKKDFRKNLTLAMDRGLSESNALAALTVTPAKLCGMEHLLGTIEVGKQANFTIVNGKGYFDPEAKVLSVWVEGRFYRVPTEEEKEKSDAKPTENVAKESPANPENPEAGRPDAANSVVEKKTEAKPATASSASDADKKQAEKEKKLAKKKELQKRVAHSPLEGRGVLTNANSILIKNATVWTCGPGGILTNAQLLVHHGKISQIGHFKTELGPDTLVVDGSGLAVTPGIIDCHSHSMILGDVNEGSLPSTAMVRIGDVVNSESGNIYEQLAGGVTAVNLLHGSANPIGGQNCVIKLRDGETPEGLKFAQAPQGIKFALGENVKQSNWGEKYVTRFPQTRMGVKTFYINRFTAAQQYLAGWEEYKKTGGLPPRRDLELEAIGEIINGTRLIHCHSYRQDEILMLMRVMETFGVKIATFQHVLEGYKIADEIAKHGAGGSTFSDWWAYKFEVYDAIPYNGSLMRERGVTVSFNSDSSDLARRLYLEAAKAVKYGNTPEIEALKFVTLNPAKQLHVDKYVGSLEVGKDADFVIWSKSPLDPFTVCQQTWIDGKKYFDVAAAPARAAALQKERADLLAKAKKLSAAAETGDEKADAPKKNSFFKQSLEHRYDGRDRHCLDEENE